MSFNGETAEHGFVLRVLVVEDNHAAAQTVGWMIEIMGFDYRLAMTPDQALSLALAYAPHVILIDIGLPGMDGFELCRQLRVMPGLERTVFMAQTGWSSDDYRHRAEDAGFHDFLLKPVALDTLQGRLQQIEKMFGRV